MANFPAPGFPAPALNPAGAILNEAPGGDDETLDSRKPLSFDAALNKAWGAQPEKNDFSDIWGRQNPADPALLKKYAPGYDPNYTPPKSPTWGDAGVDAYKAVAAEAGSVGRPVMPG